MKQGWFAFWQGLKHSLHRWQALAILYFASFLSAIPFVVLSAPGLVEAAYRPSIRQTVDGIDAWMLLESTIQINQVANDPTSADLAGGVLRMLAFGALAVVIAPFLSWVFGSFLSGGVILSFSEPERPWEWGRFLWGCWRWFGAFLLIGSIQAICGLVIFMPALLLAAWALSIQAWLAWLAVPLIALLWGSWLALFECTQIYCVAGGNSKLGPALTGVVRLLFQRPWAGIGLYITALGFLLLIQAAFRLGILPAVPLSWWPLALPAQQVFILVRLWARAGRLAGGAVLITA